MVAVLAAACADSAQSERSPGAMIFKEAGTGSSATEASNAGDMATEETVTEETTTEDSAAPDTTTGRTDGGTGVDLSSSNGADADAGGHDETAGLNFGYPVHTQAEIDAWTINSTQYTRLANSWAGNVERAHASYGAEISSVERDVLKDESVYMKVQAVLWAADAKAERHVKVTAMLDELRSVTSWEWDAGEQYRLVAGWTCTNLAQAAAILDYRDPDFITFLVDECLMTTSPPSTPHSFRMA